MNNEDLDKLSPKEFAKVMNESTHFINCKCGYTKSQKNAFVSKEKDERGYYIKCEKCNKKIYEQFMLFKNEKLKTDIVPIIHIKKR